MQMTPTINFQQYEAACRAVVAAKPKTLPTRSWQEVAILLVACLALGMLAQYAPTRETVVILLSMLLLLWVFSKPLARRHRDQCLKRLYAEEETVLNDQILTIDASGISCNRASRAVTSHHTWKAFIGAIEIADALLFLPSPNTFIRIPKELLTPSDDQQIREWSAVVPGGLSS